MRKLFAMSALAATLFAQPEAPECIPMDDFAATLRPVRLRGVDLYEPDGLAKAGSILELDLAAQPTVVRLRGAAPANLGSYCVRREDVERQIAYQPTLIRHEMDGIACVSFDEGRPHSALFQRLEHNRGAELRLYPFALSQGEWRRLDARGGFAR